MNPQDDPRASGVKLRELGHVVDVAVDDDPGVVGRGVLRHLSTRARRFQGLEVGRGNDFELGLGTAGGPLQEGQRNNVHSNSGRHRALATSSGLEFMPGDMTLTAT